MSRLRRTICVERLESRALLAASVGIPGLVVQSAGNAPQVAASIEIENAVGLRAATVEIRYDQTVLQPDIKSVRAGSLWDGKGLAIANVNDQDGTLTAFIFATQDLQLSTGTLLDIDFAFLGAATENAAAHLQLDDLRLNEGEIPVEGLTTKPAKDRTEMPLGQRRSPTGELPAEAEALPAQATPPNKPPTPSVDQPLPEMVPPSAGKASVPPRAPVASQSDAAPKQSQPPTTRPARAEPPALTPSDASSATTASEVAAADLFCTPWPSRPALAPPPADASAGPIDPAGSSRLLSAAERLLPLGPEPPAEGAAPEADAPDAIGLAAPPPIVARIVPSGTVDQGVPKVLHRMSLSEVASARDRRDSQTSPATLSAAEPSAAAETGVDAFFHGIAVGLEDLSND